MSCYLAAPLSHAVSLPHVAAQLRPGCVARSHPDSEDQ